MFHIDPLFLNADIKISLDVCTCTIVNSELSSANFYVDPEVTY